MVQIYRRAGKSLFMSLLFFSSTFSVVLAEDDAMMRAEKALLSRPNVDKAALRNQIGASTGLGADHPAVAEHADAIFRRFSEKGWIENAKNRKPSSPPPLKGDVAVVKHLKGEGGIPFVNQEEFKKAYNARLQTMLDDKKLIAAAKKGEELESDYKPSVLKSCAKSSSKVADTGYDGNEERGKKVQFDYLFIHNDDLNGLLNERHEIFGHKVNIRVVDGDQAGVLATARGFNIQCLPTRVRSTKKYVYTQSGKQALKNYDRDPHGKGTLHPLIKDVADRYK